MKLMKFHMYLGLLFVAPALMFPLTGGLYTFGIKGNYDTSRHEISIETEMTPDLAVLEPLLRQMLEDRKLDTPSGTLQIRKAGTSWQLEWTGSRQDILLEPTASPHIAALTVKETTAHRFFVQLHKAKGGILFKLLVAGFALSLVTLVTTGFLLAIQKPKLRKHAWILPACGIFIFLVVAFLS